MMTALVLGVVGRYDASNLNPSLSPLAWPDVPVVPLLAVLIAVTAAFTAPPPSLPAARRGALPVARPDDRSAATTEAEAA